MRNATTDYEAESMIATAQGQHRRTRVAEMETQPRFSRVLRDLKGRRRRALWAFPAVAYACMNVRRAIRYILARLARALLCASFWLIDVADRVKGRRCA